MIGLSIDERLLIVVVSFTDITGPFATALGSQYVQEEGSVTVSAPSPVDIEVVVALVSVDNKLVTAALVGSTTVKNRAAVF